MAEVIAHSKKGVDPSLFGGEAVMETEEEEQEKEAVEKE